MPPGTHGQLREGAAVWWREPGGEWRKGTFDSWRRSDNRARVLYLGDAGTTLTSVGREDIRRR